MSTSQPHPSQSRPRPSTPASSAQTSQHATPRSNPTAASSQASPTKTHSRNPSGSNLAARAIGSHPMQRNNSSGHGSSLSSLGATTPSQRPANGTNIKAATRPAGKTVPGMSSAGKSFGLDGSNSRPSTPSSTGASNLGIGSPAAGQLHPASAATQGSATLNPMAGLISPALSGLVPMPGSAAMDLSLSNMSALGLGGPFTGSSVGGKLDDEERRKRLETVLGTLRKRPGNMSREAIMRVGRRCDLDMLPEGEDNLSLAGNSSVVVDLHFKPNRSPYVDKATLQLLTESEELAVHSETASKILQADLSPQDGLPSVNAKLDKFAENLERLASMDRLSTPGANCFEAVFGVYQSLKRLYDHEVKLAEGLASGEKQSQLQTPETEVMCKKSARPAMHARRRVGLSLDYWRHGHAIPDARPSSADSNMMDLDNDDASAAIKDEPVEDDKVCSLTIECEHCPPALYTPMRISEDWLSKQVVIPATDESETVSVLDDIRPTPGSIDWHIPPATYKQSHESADRDPHTPSPALPHVRFVAHLEPPMVLPTQLAASICASMDTHLPTDSLASSSSYDGLVLPPATPFKQHTSPLPRTLTSTRSVPTSSDPTIPPIPYETRLYIPTSSPAVTLTSLPFAHPRQLIALLPLLRQYTLLARVLHNSISPTTATSITDSAAPIPLKPISRSAKRSARLAFPEEDELDATGEDELSAFLSAPPKTGVPCTIDATFALTPTPRIEATFPTEAGLKYVRFEVGEDGRVIVGETDVLGGVEDDSVGAVEGEEIEGERVRRTKREEGKRKMAKAMEVCEDLGLWVVWVRKKVLGEVLEVEGEGRNDDGAAMDET